MENKHEVDKPSSKEVVSGCTAIAANMDLKIDRPQLGQWWVISIDPLEGQRDDEQEYKVFAKEARQETDGNWVYDVQGLEEASELEINVPFTRFVQKLNTSTQLSSATCTPSC